MISVARFLKAMCVLASLFVFGAGFAHAVPVLSFLGLAQKIGTVAAGGGIVVDPSGNIYIADNSANTIVKISPQGVKTTLALTGLSTGLSAPLGMAFDASGNLYVADSGNSRIVMVTPALVASVVSTGGVTLSSPCGVAIDNTGNMFISDTLNNRIVKIPSGGTAVALSLSGVTLSRPYGLETDLTGNLYIADAFNNRIVKVAAGTTTASVVTTTGLTLNSPSTVIVDGTGNLYISDSFNNRIVEVDTSSNAQVLVTPSTPSTILNGPYGVALDAFGQVYISDLGDGNIYKVSPSFTPSLTSGNYYSLNRTAVGFGHTSVTTGSTITLSLPFQIGSTAVTSVQTFTNGTTSIDFTGSTNSCASITFDTCNISVSFKATAPGIRNGALVLYNGTTPLITVPLFGFGDAPVAAVGGTNVASVINTGGVAISYPFQIALDGAGNMYVSCDTGPNFLFKIPAGGGTATAIATPGYTFSETDGIAVDGSGNVFIADHIASRILVVTPAGLVSVLTINGTISPALSLPTSLALDGAGNLYIGNYGNGSVIEVSNIVVNGSTSSGLGRTLATPGFTFAGNQVTGVAVSPSGTVYIAARTANSSKVVQVTAAGVASAVTTTGFTASSPQGVFVDGMGNLYIMDANNFRILRVTSAGVASAFTLSGLPSPPTLSSGYGITADANGNLYIPDFFNSRLVSVPTSPGNLSFASTTVGSTSSDSPKAATITNLGNQALVVAATAGYTTSFINNTSDVNSCTTVASVASGQTCDISVNFVPQSTTALSSNILVSDNHLNVIGSQQQVGVSGTGVQAADTTSTSVTVIPTSIVNGQTATIAATVVDTASGKSSTVPTGSVTFTDAVGSTTISLNGGTAVTLASGSAGLSGVQFSGIGTHTITANYVGVTNTFQASSGNTTAPVTLTPATLTSPTSQPLIVNYQQASLFTEFVAGPYTTLAVPTGSLSYSIVSGSGATVVSGTKALTAGTTNSSADIPIVGTLAPGFYSIQIAYSGDANYQASTVATTVSLKVNQATPTLAWVPSPSSITYGANLTGVLDATATFGGTTVPGTFSYTATLTGGSTAAVTSATVPATAGTYSLATFFTPTDTTTYTTVGMTISYTVNKAPQTINFTAPTTPVTFGVAPITLAATGGASGNAVTFSVVSGPATVSGSTLTITGAGTVVVAANQAASTNYAAATQVTQTIVVNKTTPTIVLTSSVNPVLLNAATTLTATVSSTLATPTGTVSFYYGTTLLGTGTIASGVATFATSALPLGTDSISAVYSGDTNFLTVTSASLIETVLFDFTVVSAGGTAGSAPTATVLPGGTGTYTLTITPASGTLFPLPTTLTITGLPPGATATVAPPAWALSGTNTWTLPANTPITPLTISIQSALLAMNEHHNPPQLDRRLPLLALGVLLLPFSRRMRRTAMRAGRTISILLALAVSLAAVAGLTGCGSTNGFFGQGQQTYTVTETVTTGTISHSSTVTLIVE